MEKITIVVPFYNVEAYIDHCLTSLINQSHENIEILCIDDCSNDKSTDIVNTYAARDNRIRIIRHQVNMGLGGARNSGIKHARSKYICFVDSDDYVTDNFVSRLYETLSITESDIAVCGFWLFDQSGTKAIHPAYENTTLSVHDNKDNVFEVAEQFRPATWLKMYSRELLVSNKIYQPENRYYEGVVFWLKAVFYSSAISSIPDRLYYYRQRQGSIMSTLSYKHIEDRIEFIRQIDIFLKKYVLSVPATNTAKIEDSAFRYILKQLQYGKTLIQEADIENKRAMQTFYCDQIRQFSITHHWPGLLSICDNVEDDCID